MITLKERNYWRKVAYCHNKRARKVGAAGHLHFRAARFLYQLSGRRCLCCGASAPLSLDHIKPLALGGRGDMFNVQVLCCQCNQLKGLAVADHRRWWQSLFYGWRSQSIGWPMSTVKLDGLFDCW